MFIIYKSGIGAGHSDASWNRELSRNLGISTVPTIVGIINEKVYYFRGEYTLKNMKEFVRRLIPSKLIIEVRGRFFSTITFLKANKNF
jgi:energy-converting hydrogenase Eha subunit F